MYNKQIKTTLVLLIALSTSITETKISAHGALKKTKNTMKQTRTFAVSQINSAAAAVAQGVDHLFYPALCYMLGSYVYDNHVSKHLGNLPAGYKELVKPVPFAETARHYAVRLLVGSLAVSGTHAVLNTDLVGKFVNKNMPRLSRLLQHVATENGLSKNSEHTTSAL